MNNISVDGVNDDMRTKGSVVRYKGLKSISLERNVILRLFDIFIQQLLWHHEHEARAAVGDWNELNTSMASFKNLSL